MPTQFPVENSAVISPETILITTPTPLQLFVVCTIEVKYFTDPRTYKVSFTKIFDKLKDYYKPNWNLYNGGEDLILKLKKCNFDRKLFTGRICNRITQLKYLIENKFINEDLLWK